MSAWISSNPDNVLLAAFLLIFLVIGLRRLDYAGDGIRHLDHILQSNRPALGEPRWILFPLLLFAILKPFAAAGIIHSAQQAAKVFCLFNITCGFAYLVCLRAWLRDLPAVRRAAVLLLAGGSYAFLTLATDTIEPTPAALLAVAGLTLARFHDGFSEGRRLTIAAVSLALASLIYQGLLLGFFFLPAIFPFSFLTFRQIGLRVASAALAVPLITILLLSIGGDTPWNAARRFRLGASNTAESQQYSRVSAKNMAGVAIVGPAYAFANIPDLRGLTGTISLLRHRKTAFDGVSGAATWFCAAVAIIASMILLVFKRQFALLFAFAGMMVLPAIRMSQYSYMKYYVLLPLLVVLVVPRLGVHFAYPACLGALLLISNFAQIWTQRLESETLRQQLARELYPRIPQGSCFLTNGWGPPVPDWRGDSVAWAHILNSGNAESQQENAKANTQLLRQRLTNLFCTCPAVVTDTFIQPNLASLQQELSYFGLVDIPTSQLVVAPSNSAEILRSQRFALYRFSVGDQRRACQALENDRAALGSAVIPPGSQHGNAMVISADAAMATHTALWRQGYHRHSTLNDLTQRPPVGAALDVETIYRAAL
jgi:hypothetical protein